MRLLEDDVKSPTWFVQLLRMLAALGAGLAVTLSPVAPVRVADAATAAEPTEQVVFVRAMLQPSLAYVQVRYSAAAYDPSVGVKAYLRSKPFVVTYHCSGFFVTDRGDLVTSASCVTFNGVAKQKLASMAARWLEDNQGSVKTRFYAKKYSRAELEAIAKELRWDGQTQGRGDLSLAVASGYEAEDGSTAARSQYIHRGAELSAADDDSGLALITGITASTTIGVLLAQPGTTLNEGFAAGFDTNLDLRDSEVQVTSQVVLPVTVTDGSVSGEVGFPLTGGPAADGSGAVAGVNLFPILGDPRVTPLDTLTAFLLAHEVTPSEGALGSAYHQGVAALYTGDRATALSAIDVMLAADPANTIAPILRGRAAALPDQAPLSEATGPRGAGGLPWFPIAVGVSVLLLGLAALLVGLVLRRRRSQQRMLGAHSEVQGPRSSPVADVWAAPTTSPTLVLPAPSEPSRGAAPPPGLPDDPSVIPVSPGAPSVAASADPAPTAATSNPPLPTRTSSVDGTVAPPPQTAAPLLPAESRTPPPPPPPGRPVERVVRFCDACGSPRGMYQFCPTCGRAYP
jgi:hypothetical protein